MVSCRFEKVDDFDFALRLARGLYQGGDPARAASLANSEYNECEVILRGAHGEVLCAYPVDAFMLYLKRVGRSRIEGWSPNKVGHNTRTVDGHPHTKTPPRQTQDALPQNSGPQRPSIAGWLATILGLYLVATGVYTITQIFKPLGGSSDSLSQTSKFLSDYDLLEENAPVTIVASYVVGAPIFFGVTMMAVGSIARRRR